MNLMLKGIKYVLLTAGVNVSPKFASKVAKKYWANCSNTHGDTTFTSFEYYYGELKKLVLPTKDDFVLDAGCGSGELTHLFHKNGFNIRGFDSSTYLISNAKTKFGGRLFYVDDLVNMTHKNEKFTKIFLFGVFFYVHPAYYATVLRNLYDITEDGGMVYLVDNPDYPKRDKWYGQSFSDRWYKRLFLNVLTSFLPVYDPHSAGFWVKSKNIEKSAYAAGFSKVRRLDSWAYYRSDYILFKGKNR